jgi:hypothetical protein
MKVTILKKKDGRIFVINKPKGVSLEIREEQEDERCKVFKYHHMTDIKK